MKDKITNQDVAQSLLIRRGVRTYTEKMLLMNHFEDGTRVAEQVMADARNMIADLPTRKYDTSELSIPGVREALLKILRMGTGN